LLGENGDGLAIGGAADVLLVFGCVVELVRANAFWVAAALFAARLSSGEAGEV